MEASMWAHVREHVELGEQAYVVCSLIEESEKLEAASAEETHARLSDGELKGLRVGLLHGRMKSDEKEAVMTRFRHRDLDVLVATTVIEVGVDVPNATTMVVVDADRFGIAQLHQLRGRVGRGAVASTCFLQTSADEPGPRVEALVDSTNGFELAEVDLALRGEGTLMGAAQKGRSDLKLASLQRDLDLIQMARDAAFDIIDADPTLSKHELLRDELDLLFSQEEEEFLFRG
jgi:ATP-dependent DNA helicase RecG